MLYTAKNAPRAAVHDVDALQPIERVMEVNTKAGWVKVADHPIQLNAHRHVACRRIRFRSIYAIRGMESLPCLFHCYGRLPEASH